MYCVSSYPKEHDRGSSQNFKYTSTSPLFGIFHVKRCCFWNFSILLGGRKWFCIDPLYAD
jgi:hypothetical protein